MRVQIQVLVCIVLALVLGGCGSNPSSPEDLPEVSSGGSFRITFVGSTSVQPLVEKLGAVYQAKKPGIAFEIAGGGSRAGIQAIQDGTVDVGMASRELTEEEKSGLTVHQIAVDVLAVVVHPSNTVEQLSMEQLRGIYEGYITNWQEVGGNDVPILPVVRGFTSGTRGAFDAIVLDGGDPTEHAVEQFTAGEMYVHVSNTEGAIGYVGFAHLGEEVKVLRIDGVEPSPETALDGSYKLKRPLLLLTNQLSSSYAFEFITFVLSEEGQQVVVEDGWVPVQ